MCNCMYWDNSVGTVQCLKHQFADKILNVKGCNRQQSLVLEFHNKKVMNRVREITKIM